MAQTKITTITGKVISFEESTAIEGVSVLVKGTDRNTGSQADGTFYINVSPENRVLIFRHVEYEIQEVEIMNSNDYDIVLKRKPTNAVSGGRVEVGWCNTLSRLKDIPEILTFTK